MPRNPSELARLEEELQLLKERMVNGYQSKGTKEQMLKEMRGICDQLGIDMPTYNSTEFSEWLRKDL